MPAYDNVDDYSTIWVFNGILGNFPSGVFSSRDKAELWIAENKLSGTLTKYPIDISTYDWARKEDLFTPEMPHEFSKEYIQRFSTAWQEHYHYEDGIEGGGSENRDNFTSAEEPPSELALLKPYLCPIMEERWGDSHNMELPVDAASTVLRLMAEQIGCETWEHEYRGGRVRKLFIAEGARFLDQVGQVDQEDLLTKLLAHADSFGNAEVHSVRAFLGSVRRDAEEWRKWLDEEDGKLGLRLACD